MTVRQYCAPRPELATRLAADEVLACSGHNRLIGLRVLAACPIGHTFERSMKMSSLAHIILLIKLTKSTPSSCF